MREGDLAALARRMSRLSQIPVRVEGTLPAPHWTSPAPKPAPDGERSAGLGGGIAAILMELATCLDHLAQHDESAVIDLRSLPMSPSDRRELQQALGDGEVQATLNAEGASTLRETQFAGIWWIEHRDRDGELVAELLEVARFPQILSTVTDEIALAAAALRGQVNGSPAPAAPRGRP
jgi:hydrogenase-1 operon protein HyaF